MKTKSLLPVLLLTIALFNDLFSQVTFTDVAVTMGVNDPGAAQGVVFIDVNNDGFLDILLINNATQSKLWINNNGTSFTESSTAWGINLNIAGRGLSCADYNNDGYVDVAIGSWQIPIRLYKNTGTAFVDVTTESGVGLISYGGSINWIDYNKDGKIDFLFANDGIPPRYNYFFKNNNLINFTNIAYSIGFVDSLSTLCLAAADYDNDGDLDIYCGAQTSNANGTGVLYRNNGDGTFTDVTNAAFANTFGYTWGAEWGDFNNDGFMDLYLAHSTGVNQLFKNNGNGTFTDVAGTMGVNDAGTCYSIGWADYDNDGDLDLYLAKGQNVADKMYRNDGLTFTDVSTQVGMGDLRHSSCVSWGDFNNDGYLDLYLNNNGSENRLYKNNAESTNKWVIFRLNGVNTNRSAIGSRVTIKTGSLTQIREVEGGSGGKGQNSLPVEFGIGSATIIDSVIIRWYNGLTQRFANVTPNVIYNITEGQPLGINNNIVGIPSSFKLYQNYPNPFNPSTKIKFDIPNNLPLGRGVGGMIVSLKIFDILGKEIATLVNEPLSPGSYEVDWNASNFPSGVYFYQLKTDKFIKSKKLILIK
jgi:hypothetical protein